jgi:hypothetical protein
VPLDFPNSPVDGQIYENYIWNATDSVWQGLANQVVNPIISNSPTGTYTSGGVSYNFLTFTGNGTVTVTRGGRADVLVVGGGGGAVSTPFAVSAGGGGGGVLYNNLFLEPGNYDVIVGAGGIGNSVENVRAGNGGFSAFGTLMRVNGGAGGYAINGANWILNGAAGAGGGEGGVYSHSSATKPRGSGAGSTVFGTNTFDGRVIDITGSNVTYGAAKGTDAGAGGANTGDGAGARTTGAAGQNGGSGVVIVRWRA